MLGICVLKCINVLRFSLLFASHTVLGMKDSCISQRYVTKNNDLYLLKSAMNEIYIRFWTSLLSFELILTTLYHTFETLVRINTEDMPIIYYPCT